MKIRAGLALLAVAGLAAIAVAVATASTDSGRAPAAQSATQAASCKKPTIGMSAPITGPAGSIGSDQLKWATYYVQRWNALHKKFRVTLKQFDDQIDPAKAATGAQQFASDSSVLAVIGPAGSQQVVAAAPIYKRAGLAIVSGSATRVSLTDGSLKGTFFRVVPNDGIQAPSDVKYALTKLGVKSGDSVMLVDDSEAYGTGLRDIMRPLFEAKGVKVDTESVAQTDTDFTSLVNKTTSSTKVVFFLTQIASQSQLFAQQMKEKGRTAPVFGTDGSFDSSKFNVEGSYVSFFAPDVTTLTSAKAIVNGFYARYGHSTTPFGAPNYVVAQLEIAANQKACADGRVTRGEVRKIIAKTNMKTSLLGVPIKFTPKGDVSGAKFFVFKIVGGTYTLVG